MEVKTTVCAILTLLRTMQDPQLKLILSIIGHGSQLDGLESVVNTILGMLRSAEDDEFFNYSRIKDLMDAVYKGNTELEKLISLAAQQQLLKSYDDSSITLREKIGLYYYHFNRLGVPYRVSQVVKNISSVLDIHVSALDDYDLTRKAKVYKAWEVHSSYGDSVDIIGRQNDLEIIMRMLLSSTNQNDVSFLSIAGVAGLGKTVLAQLVYNDDRVIDKFPLRLWVRVADHSEKLEVKIILDKILKLVTREEHDVSSISDHTHQVQILRQKLQLNRYLLVLDDVWTENRWLLHDLVTCLIPFGGQRGSWVIVTTRSRRTATGIQDGQLYELQGLPDEDSLKLFQRVALEANEPNKKDLLEIGQGILAGCARNPFAIKVAGSLLYGQDKRHWQKLRDIRLANIGEFDSIPLFRLSYDYLESPLKSCFIYCALFPKDFTVNKDMLISLWMAHDYVVDSLNRGFSADDVGDEYFSILLDRYFFNDIKRDEYGEIVSCKIQDLIHDVAQHVAGKEMYTMSDFQNKPTEGAHHVLVLGGKWIGYDFLGNNNSNILSYLHVGYNKFHFCKVEKSSLELLLVKCRSLRVLDLGGLFFEILPDSIGELSLLRYLSISGNTEIEVLPRTITKLLKLQTLNLQNCHKLKDLPKDFSKLVNLRVFNIRNCSSLTSMPRDIGTLTCLCRLSDFAVGDKGDDSSWKEVFDALEDLKTLDNLRGHLNIAIRCPIAKYVAKEDVRREGFYPLRSKKHLKIIELDFKHEEDDGRLDIEGVTRLMTELEPHSNLQYIKLCRYKGVTMGWDTFPSNLVQLVMVGCSKLECLPCLGNLYHLKVLQLLNLKNLAYIGQDGPLNSSPTFPSNLVQLVMVGCSELECLPYLGNLYHLKVLQFLNLKNLAYIGQDGPLANSSPTATSQFVYEGLSSYYPSLETLWLENLPKLKGWMGGTVDDHQCQILNDEGGSSSSIDRKAQRQSPLKSLFIRNCPQLIWIPPCPTVEDLKLFNFNSSLRIMENIEEGGKKFDVASSSSSCNGVDIPESSSHGSYIKIGKNMKVVLSNLVWLNLLPMEAFKRLENLEIWCDKEVESLGEVEEVFRSCSFSLKVLIIHNCSNLKTVVPGGLEYLTSLEKLELRNCDNLTLSEEQGEGEEQREEPEDSIAIDLVNWSSKLRALHTLKLDGLPQLVNLPDWIQFLPDLRCLCVSFCNRLTSMPEWLPKVTSLRQIIVHGCSASLEKKCQELEDWPHIHFRNCVF